MDNTVQKKDQQMPLVTIIIPTYNAEKFLPETIDSILTQTYTNWELIIINDGSTDNTEIIIRKYNDERIKYLSNEKNTGIVYSINRGIDVAKGEYIARLDADDVALPIRIEKQVEYLTIHLDFALCGSYFHTIDTNGRFLKNVMFPSNNKDAQTYLLLHNCFCHSSIMMRASVLKEFRYLEEYFLCEDYDLWYRISRNMKITNIPVFTTLYRIHPNNISTTRRNDMFYKLNKINKRILTDLHVSFTQEELEIHSNCLFYNSEFFDTAEKISSLEQWIIKLYKEFKKNNNYNFNIVYRILAEKWIVICSKSKNHNKLLLNRIILKHPVIYSNLLFKKVKKTIQPVKPVIIK